MFGYDLDYETVVTNILTEIGMQSFYNIPIPNNSCIISYSLQSRTFPRGLVDITRTPIRTNDAQDLAECLLSPPEPDIEISRFPRPLVEEYVRSYARDNLYRSQRFVSLYTSMRKKKGLI